jgi:nitroreductase
MRSLRGLKVTIKRFTPGQLINLYQSLNSALSRMLHYRNLWRNFDYDRTRFAKHSAVVRRYLSKENLAALITMDYHRLEKGMSLREPRMGYASKWISPRFIKNLKSYIALEGAVDELARTAIDVLRAYRDFHIQNNFSMPKLFSEISEFEQQIDDREYLKGGRKVITRKDIQECGMIEIGRFMHSRHSIRQFSNRTVSQDLVVECVSLAQRTPSVCNRQDWHVYAINEPDAITRALAVQNGNAGFGHQLNTVLAVTSDLTRLLTIGERNQGWIDGGMFCMSLVLALHSKGLGTCCLNLSLDYKQDIEFRKAVPISSHESPLMLIAVGHIPESLTVAQSIAICSAPSGISVRIATVVKSAIAGLACPVTRAEPLAQPTRTAVTNATSTVLISPPIGQK